jgi:ribokinase
MSAESDVTASGGVLVAGAINTDLVGITERAPEAGETVTGTSFGIYGGGKGANQAVAARRMGAATLMVGAVGEDDAGRFMLDRLAAEGIDITAVSGIPDAQTGMALIAVDAEGENQIVVAAGANARLPAVEPVAAGVLLTQLEVPVDRLQPLFAASTARRLLNAAPPVAGARALLGDVDVLIVNEHELAVLAGAPAAGHGAMAAAARALMVRADQAVIVTLGAAGVLAVWGGAVLHLAAAKVRPVDTVGAGDCFCGALAACLDEGAELEAALGMANGPPRFRPRRPGVPRPCPTAPGWPASRRRWQQTMRIRSRPGHPRT